MAIVGLRAFRCLECRKRFYLNHAYGTQVRRKREVRRSVQRQA